MSLHTKCRCFDILKFFFRLSGGSSQSTIASSSSKSLLISGVNLLTVSIYLIIASSSILNLVIVSSRWSDYCSNLVSCIYWFNCSIPFERSLLYYLAFFSNAVNSCAYFFSANRSYPVIDVNFVSLKYNSLHSKVYVSCELGIVS
jgi:hypothetical protein